MSRLTANFSISLPIEKIDQLERIAEDRTKMSLKCSRNSLIQEAVDILILIEDRKNKKRRTT